MTVGAEEQERARMISAFPDRLELRSGGGAVLLGTRCEDCAAIVFGSARACRRCTSERLAPVELTTEGTILSYTYVVRAAASWTGSVPYALAEVVLPEGVAVTARVDGWHEGEALAVGDPLELAVVPADRDEEGNEIVVYAWRRLGAATAGERS